MLLQMGYLRVVDRWRHEMEIPCKPVSEWPPALRGAVRANKVILQGRSDVVGVAVRPLSATLAGCMFNLLPEVEVLGHVDLLEDVYEPLFLCRLINPVVG